jgi:4-aminobutyrate aminotransferase-like enzyme
MTAHQQTNLELWQQHGDYVLMAMPYADQVVVRARGCMLEDADGKQLLDLASGMFCCVLGHNHPKFIDKVRGQIDRVLHTGTQFLSPAVLEASHKLADVTPGHLQKSVFLSTGTEANEFAFRLAKAFTGRTGIVGLSRGYYGTSVATKSCSGLFSHGLRDSLPTVPENYRLPITSDCARCFTSVTSACKFPCLDSVEDWIGDWSNVAAVVVEPFLSAGGMLIPPSGYLRRLSTLAHSRGALLIVDEAQTGFGRTGKWFAIEHHDVVPDIMSLSKSVGNGFPAAAVITTAEIADQVVSDGLWNLSSHQSDPAAAAAVAAVIDVVREEGLIDRAIDSGAYFIDRLRDLAARQPLIQNVRGQGLMIGFDLGIEQSEAGAAAMRFMYGCRARGVHLTYGYGHTNIRIIPPLVITRAEIDRGMTAIEAALHDLASGCRSDEGWPRNAQTASMLKQKPVRRLLKNAWQSSPKRWFEKGSKLVSQALGGGAR